MVLPDWRLCAGDDLAVEFVHAGQRHVVADEVDEAVARRPARELVLDHLDGEDIRLAHGLHRLEDEVLVHIGLKPPDPQSSFSTHLSILKFTGYVKTRSAKLFLLG